MSASQLVTPAATTGLAAQINGLIDDLGLKISDLSTATKIPRTTLDRSLAGIRAFNTNELFAIAAALHTTPDDLIAAARAAA